jgi:hypothetical protein
MAAFLATSTWDATRSIGEIGKLNRLDAARARAMRKPTLRGDSSGDAKLQLTPQHRSRAR